MKNKKNHEIMYMIQQWKHKKASRTTSAYSVKKYCTAMRRCAWTVIIKWHGGR